MVNEDPSRGLCFFRNGRPPVMLQEETGVVFRVSGEVRWKWMHGFSARTPVGGEAPKHLRTSVTFRFFNRKGKSLSVQYKEEHNQKWLNNSAKPIDVHAADMQTVDSWQMSQGFLGHAGFNFVKGKTSVEDVEKEVKYTRKPKAARPTDMNSYNLMKMLGLNAVKPTCNNDIIFGDNEVPFQS